MKTLRMRDKADIDPNRGPQVITSIRKALADACLAEGIGQGTLGGGGVTFWDYYDNVGGDLNVFIKEPDKEMVAVPMKAISYASDTELIMAALVYIPLKSDISNEEETS